MTCNLLFVMCCVASADSPIEPPILQVPKEAKFQFGGIVGERIDANIENWLLQAPIANPGMLEMFRVRDRKPVPNLVPWAGEFAGKYLISAIQALRMSDEPRLEKLVREVIEELLACQAEDGYLGPFPRDQRLLGNWDLWGHYHIMLALLMWHERTGDERALSACRRMADLVCKTYLNTDKRVFDAGSHEMNMAILHSLGWLYRVTKEPRYLAMVKEIQTDWERAGDYYRAGLAQQPFFRTPRPRWESLHDVEGLFELYQITGNATYEDALHSHWSSIADWDLRNTGGFSSGEQATGNPFEDTAIETCCTIAWSALSIDELRARSDCRTADLLDLALFNAILGAQHPSGRWWTYSTPMNGVKEASAHSIVFQSRAGTPELNCCSVNGPRGLGMLSEWAVLRDNSGIWINYLGPMNATFRLADGTLVGMSIDSGYPLSGSVKIRFELSEPREFLVCVRIPRWAENPVLRVGNESVQTHAGSHSPIAHTWKNGDVIHLHFEPMLWTQTGDLNQDGRVSIYRGPILLAWDQEHNDFDEENMPVVDVERLKESKVTIPDSKGEIISKPWVVVDVPVADGNLRLCDFASAGMNGTRYRSWLPAKNAPPPAPAVMPLKRAIPPGPIAFRWRAPSAKSVGKRTFELTIIHGHDWKNSIVHVPSLKGSRYVLPKEDAAKLKPGVSYQWRLAAREGDQVTLGEAQSLQIDDSLPRTKPADNMEYGERDDGILVEAPLRGNPDPVYGKLDLSIGIRSCEGPNGAANTAIELSGERPIVRYMIRQWPEESYSIATWVKLPAVPNRLAQIASGWSRGSDDPLRICIEGNRLFARIEAGAGYSTQGVEIPLGEWFHVAAVKEGSQLRLYLNGKEVSATAVATIVRSPSTEVAIGGNPHFDGDESLPGRYAAFRFYARALATTEIGGLAKRK